jgi:hypothetical protein
MPLESTNVARTMYPSYPSYHPTRVAKGPDAAHRRHLVASMALGNFAYFCGAKPRNPGTHSQHDLFTLRCEA